MPASLILPTTSEISSALSSTDRSTVITSSWVRPPRARPMRISASN